MKLKHSAFRGIFRLCLQITKATGFGWRHSHVWLYSRDLVHVSVYECVSTRRQCTAGIRACIYVQFTSALAECRRPQTAAGERGLSPAYRRYLWNVPSWRGASARCDPSRTVCSCPRHASSSGKENSSTES